MVRTILAALACLLLCACSQVAERGADAPRWIVSLDYCADQYVLKFADREDILALSPDAGKRFSYMRAAAEGIPTVRPRTADVLALQPDWWCELMAAGTISPISQEPGVPVVQIGFQSIRSAR